MGKYKYIRKVMTKSGKWRYIYQETDGHTTSVTGDPIETKIKRRKKVGTVPSNAKYRAYKRGSGTYNQSPVVQEQNAMPNYAAGADNQNGFYKPYMPKKAHRQNRIDRAKSFVLRTRVRVSSMARSAISSGMNFINSLRK